MPSNKDNEKLFIDALAASAKQNYLGDRSVVEAIIRFAVSDVTTGFEEAETPESRINLMQKAAKGAASVLLGQDKNYSPVRNWNRPGGIDVFCAHWLGSSETDPEVIMEHSMVKLFNEILDVAEYAGEPGILDEQWKWMIDDAVDRYTGIFMGIDPPSQAVMSILDKESDEVIDDE